MTEPIRKSLLPTTPPPEWEFSTVLGGRAHGCMVVPGDMGPVVVRRRVTFGDWEPVRPDHWADELDEPDVALTAVARQTTGQDDTEPAIVAYRSVYAPGLLFCRAHNQGWPGFTPLTSDDLPDGGICTWGPNDGPKCGRDVLIDEPSPAPAVGQPAEAQATDAAPLTAAERKFLHFALDQAAEEMSYGDGFTDEDQAALDRLRLLAGKDER